MFVVTFHMFYLLGKQVYKTLCTKKFRTLTDTDVAEKDSNPQCLHNENCEVEGDEESRPAKLSDQQTIKFHPPAYIQRYQAVANVLTKYEGKLRKIIDFGCGELRLVSYLKHISGVEEILCVDTDRNVLDDNKYRAKPLAADYLSKRMDPLVIEVCEGDVTRPNKKLKKTDAVICIELIEHLYKNTLKKFHSNIFGYIMPKVVIITTPNADFNVLFPNFKGFRHPDHKFEWTRQEFQAWAHGILKMYPFYSVTFEGICNGPEGTEKFGPCTQMAIFDRNEKKYQQMLKKRMKNKKIKWMKRKESIFNTLVIYDYPIADCRPEEEKILEEALYYINYLRNDDPTEEDDVYLCNLVFIMRNFKPSIETLKAILEKGGWHIKEKEFGPAVVSPPSKESSSVNIDSFDDIDIISDSKSFSSGEDNWIFEYTSSVCAKPSEQFLPNNDREHESAAIVPIKPPEMNNTLDIDNFNDHNGFFSSEQNNLSFESNSSIFLNTAESFLPNYNKAWNEEPSIIIPQNCTIDRENSYLFDGENFSTEEISSPGKSLSLNNHVEESLSTINNIKKSAIPSSQKHVNNQISLVLDKSKANDAFQTVDFNLLKCTDSVEICNRNLNASKDSLVKNITTQPALPCNVEVTSKVVQENYKHSILPTISGSSTPEPFIFNIELENSSNYYSASDRNESSDNQSLLDSTFSMPEIDMMITNVKDYTAKDVYKIENFFSEKSNVQRKEIDFEECASQNYSFSPAFCSDINYRLKTSSPKLRKEALDILKQNNHKGKELTFAMTSDIELNAIKPVAEIVCSSDVGSLECTDRKFSDSNNGMAEGTDLCVTCSNNDDASDVTLQYNTNISANNKTQESKSKEFSSNDRSVFMETMRDAEEESMEEKDLINHETSTGRNNVQKFNARVSLSNDEEKNARRAETNTSLKTDDYEGKEAHVRNVTSDLVRSNTSEKCSSSFKNPISLLYENDSESFSECAKEIKNTSDNDNFRHCENDGDTNDTVVEFTSVLKNSEDVGYNTKDSTNKDVDIINIAGSTANIEVKLASPIFETPADSWSHEIADSGYPNSASAQDITPENDLSSIAQDHISDIESPSVAEAPRIDVLEPIEVENGDLANNNRDDEGNNMIAMDANDIEGLQPLINVLENDIENENDIYVLENGFPIWLLRILNMANPFDIQPRQNLEDPEDVADDANN